MIKTCNAHDVINNLYGLHCMLKARYHKILGNDTGFDNTEEVAYCDFYRVNIQFNECACYQVKYIATTNALYTLRQNVPATLCL